MDNFVKQTLENALQEKTIIDLSETNQIFQHSNYSKNESFKYSKFSPFRKNIRTNRQETYFPRPPTQAQNNTSHTRNSYTQTRNSYTHKTRDLRNKEKRSICRNCGIQGHLVLDCKQPIQSYGLFILNQSLSKVLVIQRRDSLGYISLINNEKINQVYISNIAKTITQEEQSKIMCFEFEEMWKDIIHNPRLRQNRNIIQRNKERFNNLQIRDIVHQIDKSTLTSENEWGFPKGKIQRREKWSECAKRETSEEIGISQEYFTLLSDMPFMENIKGTDGKMYINVYYVAMMKPEQNQFDPQKEEIRDVKWIDIEELEQFFDLAVIENQTKKKLIHQVKCFIKTLNL